VTFHPSYTPDTPSHQGSSVYSFEERQQMYAHSYKQIDIEMINNKNFVSSSFHFFFPVPHSPHRILPYKKSRPLVGLNSE